MAMLKTLAGYTVLAGKNRMQKYLETGAAASAEGRAVAYFERGKTAPDRLLGMDFIGLTRTERARWGSVMDETRKDCGNDQPWNKKNAVFYRQFIISPDPEDKVSLEDLRELATTWAKLMFGPDGEIGSFQVAIAYHDDNENRIPHAHIVVNNTDLNTRKRMHIDSVQYGSLRTSLQEMCIKRGMHHLDFEADEAGAYGWFSKPASEPHVEKRTKAEYRAAVAKERADRERAERMAAARAKPGRWTEELREKVYHAMRSTADANDFFAMLTGAGIAAEIRPDGDILYRHPSDPENRKIRGKTLGVDFTQEGVREALIAGVDDVMDRAVARAAFDKDMKTIADRQRGMRIAGKGKGNSQIKLGNTIWKSNQEVYRTDAERNASKSVAHLWKDDLRQWSQLAADTSNSLEEYRARLAEFNVVTEVKRGDILYHHPSAPDTRLCYGKKLGQRFTPEGVMQMQYVAQHVQRSFALNPGFKASLVEVKSYRVPGGIDVTLQEAADTLWAIRKSDARSPEDLVNSLARARGRLVGIPADDAMAINKQKEYIAQLECAIKTAPKLGLFDYTLPPAQQAERRRQRAIASLQPMLQQKIRSGVKHLPRAEYDMLTPQQIKIWKQYREQRIRAERMGASPASSSSSGTRSGSSSQSRSKGRSI